MQEEREPSSGQNHCIDGSNLCNLIHTLGMRNEVEEAGMVVLTEGSSGTFSEGVSLEETSVLTS